LIQLHKVQAAIEKIAPSLELSKKQKTKLKDYLSAQFQKIISSTEEIDAFNEAVSESLETGFFFSSEFKTQSIAKKFLNGNLQGFNVEDWKRQTLLDRPVVAVDGSQMNPDKNLNFVLAALQIGWFINWHSQSKPYEKNIDFEMIVPSEDLQESVGLEGEIAYQRFSREVNKIEELIQKLSTDKYSKTPLALFDGGFTLSFLIQPGDKKKHFNSLQKLFKLSHKFKIPVVAFVDSSMSSSITTTIKSILNDEDSTKLPDVNLFSKELSGWGDRSSVFIHHDKNLYPKREDFSDDYKVAYCYLKTSTMREYPSRVEFPLWIYKEGLLDEVVNVLLAECLIGNGYPYPLEVADSVSVIQSPERKIILRALEKKMGEALPVSSKLGSKLGRRKPKIQS
jgi:hypothetical protein